LISTAKKYIHSYKNKTIWSQNKVIKERVFHAANYFFDVFVELEITVTGFGILNTLQKISNN
jgi:hypothetical protein